MKIYWLENCPCNSKKLEAREGYYIQNTEYVNRCIAGRTKKEWGKNRANNKEKLNKYHKEWRQNNQEHLHKYKKEYNEETKNKKWQEQNKEHKKQKDREDRETHKEKLK